EQLTDAVTARVSIKLALAPTCCWLERRQCPVPVFFFNDPPPPDIYTLSLHDALPIFTSVAGAPARWLEVVFAVPGLRHRPARLLDRKSTRLNSSHVSISYAVFRLKKKKHDNDHHQHAEGSPEGPLAGPSSLPSHHEPD